MRALKIILILGAILLVAGCEKQPQSSGVALQQRTSLKPIVALVPIIDHSRSHLAWNLSEELTSAIHYRLTQKDKLYLIEPSKVAATLKKLKDSNNPFDVDLTWIKKAFFEDEFVVFMEILSHDQVAINAKDPHSPQEAPAELTISMRLRVIDLRGEEPAIALQEILHNSHYLPKQFTSSHFEQVEWGKDAYAISPLGLAHAGLSKEIASRVEDYILSSMSKPHG